MVILQNASSLRTMMCVLSIVWVFIPNHTEASRGDDQSEPLLGAQSSGGGSSENSVVAGTPGENLWNEIMALKPKVEINQETSKERFIRCLSKLSSFSSPEVRIIKNKKKKFRAQLFVTGENRGICYSVTNEFEGIQEFTKQGRILSSNSYTNLCGKSSRQPGPDNQFTKSVDGLYDRETGVLVDGRTDYESNINHYFLVSEEGSWNQEWGKPFIPDIAESTPPHEAGPALYEGNESNLPPPPAYPPSELVREYIVKAGPCAASAGENSSNWRVAVKASAANKPTLSTSTSSLKTGTYRWKTTYMPRRANFFTKHEEGIRDVAGNWLDVIITYEPRKENCYIESGRAKWDSENSETVISELVYSSER